MVSPVDVPEAKERRCAWALYVFLFAVFFGYVVYTIVDGVQQREDPPTSFEREEMVWNLPHIVAEGTRPTFGECTFSLAFDDDDTERECNVEFYADEESDDDEGVLVFFLGDFNIEELSAEYTENAGEDDPEFDQSFVEGFVVLGFEEVGELWETPVGLCAAAEFPAEEDRNYDEITDACPINTYVPIGAVRQGQDSQAYASNFVLEAEVFRTLEEEEYFSYSSSVSSTIWNIESGSLDDAFSLSVDNKQNALSANNGKKSHKSNKQLMVGKNKASPSSWRHKHKPKKPTAEYNATQNIDLQQDSSSPLGYAGQVWFYQQTHTVGVTSEQDPLDILALFGQWGGAFTYVAIIFGLVFTAGKGGVRYNRFSKESAGKYKRTPASKKGKKDKKKKKKKDKDEDESEDEDDDEDDDDDDDEGMEV